MRLALAATLLLAACSAGPRDTASPSASALPSIASARPPPPPSPRRTDPRWLAARNDDPLDKARLAEAVGAAELLAGVEDGDEMEATALAALPFADDGDVALGRLGEMAASDAGRRPRVLEVILAIAGQPRRPRELLDPEGVRRCGEAVLGVAADRSVPREQRALAVSAARALAEKGYVDKARIPDDLDPR